MNNSGNFINILFISSRADIGGGPLQMFDVISNIDRNRFTLFAALPDEEPFYGKIKSIGVRALAIKKRALSIFDFIKLVKFVYSNNIDIVHSHGKGAGIYSRLLKIFCPQIKVVHTFHGFHYDNLSKSKECLHKSVEKVLARITDKFVNVSEGEQLQYASAGLLDFKKSVLIKNYLPLEKLKTIEKLMQNSSGKTSSHKTLKAAAASKVLAEKACRVVSDCVLKFCAVARFDPVKQMPFLIESFFKVASSLKSEEKIKLILIGGGEEYNKCVKIAEQMNDDSLIEFLGERPDALEIMAGCDIYVSASRREGLSMSMLEAAAIGMPILAPRVAGIAELVRPYEKGVMFENGDYESFKAGLAEIVEKYSEARNENVNETTAGFASKYEEHSNYIKKYEKLYIETINGL